MAFTYSWSSIADSAIDPDSPIDTALMTAIRNNLVYLYEYIGGQDYTPAEPHDHDGTNSAPVNVASESQLSSSVVSQAKLKTTTGELTATSSANQSIASTALPGGEYGFIPQVRASGGNTNQRTLTFNWTSGQLDSATTDTGYNTLKVSASGTSFGDGTIYIRQRYVQSSPPWEPYRAGDAVPLFVFALRDRATGAVVATYTAEDPPWCNHGPTIVNPYGRLLALAHQYVAAAGSAPAEQLEAWADFDEWFRDAQNARQIAAVLNRRLTQAEKNADMAIVPHPFGAVDSARHVVVAVHPTDDRFGRALRARFLYGGDSIGELLAKGHFIVDNEPIADLRCPAGVLPVRARLRLTR